MSGSRWRYLALPRYVRSAVEAAQYYVGGAELAWQYGLNPSHCLVLQPLIPRPEDPALRPDLDLRDLRQLPPRSDLRYGSDLLPGCPMPGEGPWGYLVLPRYVSLDTGSRLFVGGAELAWRYGVKPTRCLVLQALIPDPQDPRLGPNLDLAALYQLRPDRLPRPDVYGSSKL
ncbi:MAG: hypothetical protein AAGD06_23205 [Acidobacteriota bacterium]